MYNIIDTENILWNEKQILSTFNKSFKFKLIETKFVFVASQPF